MLRPPLLLFPLALWLALARCVTVRAATPDDLRSGNASLAIIGVVKPSGLGIALGDGKSPPVYEQRQPVAIGVVDAKGVETWLRAGYETIEPIKEAQEQGKGTLVYDLSVVVRSAAGTRFRVKDTYAPLGHTGSFTLTRLVTVESPQPGDVAFDSEFQLLPVEPSAMGDNDFFAPGIWYGKSKLPPHALAANPADRAFLFREDRLPLPLIAARNRTAGATCLVAHLDGVPATFAGESGRARIVDARMQFGSLGIERTDDFHAAPTFRFPGSEGERTYIRGGGASGPDTWAYRSHPVATGVKHFYRLLLRASKTDSFAEAVRDSWRTAYAQADPPIVRADQGKVYRDGMNLLDALCRPYQGVVGVPFAATVPQGETVDPSSQMGFVGQALPSAALLLRYGYETRNADTVARASAVVDYWAKNSLSPSGSGVPRTWYDVHPDGPVTWRNYHTFLRVASDGCRARCRRGASRESKARTIPCGSRSAARMATFWSAFKIRMARSPANTTSTPAPSIPRPTRPTRRFHFSPTCTA